jgi:hypothetical protein
MMQIGNMGQLWHTLESQGQRPDSLRSVVEVDYSDLGQSIDSEQFGLLSDLVRNLYAGDLVVAKSALGPDFLERVQEQLIAYSNAEPESFHKMTEGCPNFHRIIDEENARKYSVESIRHSYHLFNWNEDRFGIMSQVYPIWRQLKILMGLSKHAYERNTPKDGIVDRVQIVRYPPNSGYIEPHVHHPKNQRLIINVYMSQISIDFESGGVYFLDEDSCRIYVEDQVEIGDVGIFYATIRHGVAPVKARGLTPDDQTDKSGRWWMGLYSPESDTMSSRVTSSPSK